VEVQEDYNSKLCLHLLKIFLIISTLCYQSSTSPKLHTPTLKLFTRITFLSLLLASSTLLHPTIAFPTFTSSTVAYLTNCQTSDTLAPYSEVSIYGDVAQSFSGQNPDTYADTLLGAWTNWEGNSVQWSYNGLDLAQPDKFTEFINANAQDPAVPTFAQVGCGTYSQGFSDGAVVAWRWNCYKDSPRVLYTTADHECSTVYYCRISTDPCPFTSPGKFHTLECIDWDS
jgi:hypothetical protein